MMLPKWWNGRHEGLKIPWPQGCAGSSPAFGTVNKEISSPFRLEISHIYTFIFLASLYQSEKSADPF